MNQQQARNTIVDWACSTLGRPYVSGAFDCSAMVQGAYRAAGLLIPRVSWDQFEAGVPTLLEYAEPGDPVFFAHTYDPGFETPNPYTHVGIFVGLRNGVPWMVDAREPVCTEEPIVRYWVEHQPVYVRMHALADLPAGPVQEPALPPYGTIARIEADELRLRKSAGLQSTVLGLLPDKSKVVVLSDAPALLDGYLWVRVASRIGIGYLAADPDWFIVEGQL